MLLAEKFYENPAFWSMATTVIMSIMAYLQRHYANAAAAKVAEVKSTLEVTTVANDAKMADLKETGEKNHRLLNSKWALALETIRNLTKKVAEHTGDPKDFDAAKRAQIDLDEHAKKQAMVDLIDAQKIGRGKLNG